MANLDENQYREHFFQLAKRSPYDYQIDVARLLLEGRNLMLRAPTGAGKTMAVIAPFLFPQWTRRPTKLIYALPLRTLAQGVFNVACEAAGEKLRPFVTLQTGEQPDDPFFDRGLIIVTTYDQVFSGLLNGPYGLSDRLHNIDAAAIAGALVVFDEFHLMPAQKAFLTAVAGLHLFRNLCQSAWMTATATQPLETVLCEALGTARIPSTPDKARALHTSLPSVRDVTRNLVVEDEPLFAEAVLRFLEGRSVVLANTVGRAQALFRNISDELSRQGSKVPLRLLHSRFFKQDRQTKENELRSLFGPDARSPAILVATQVVEAGIDISCHHLHTELCPMNSLVQRAGRCARFPGEAGTVHVYPLPNTPRNWLPYGDLNREDHALERTRALLNSVRSVEINPQTTAQWVEEVHVEDDAQAVRAGWVPRKAECIERIRRKAIQRDNHSGIADLIRGEDSDSIRVIIAYEENRPDTPGKREGISLTRWSLARVLDGPHDIGWFWDSGGDEPAWKLLRARDDLRNTYAVCLRPAVASYTEKVGLILGMPGDRESPDREAPRRPGYAPLHEETWVHHARCVAEETEHRMNRECAAEGFLAAGLTARYNLGPDALREAARACALLHDLGKLQTGWQRWAEAAMLAKRPSYQHIAPLAHTDFDPENDDDRQRERELASGGFRRPAHAPASAFYSLKLIPKLVLRTPDAIRKQVASACLAAVLAHHGGWAPGREKFGQVIGDLAAAWKSVLPETLGDSFQANRLLWPTRQPDKYGQLSAFLDSTVGPDSLAEWWPLVSYLTRTLRLSDQRATAEAHNHE